MWEYYKYYIKKWWSILLDNNLGVRIYCIIYTNFKNNLFFTACENCNNNNKSWISEIFSPSLSYCTGLDINDLQQLASSRLKDTVFALVDQQEDSIMKFIYMLHCPILT